MCNIKNNSKLILFAFFGVILFFYASSISAANFDTVRVGSQHFYKSLTNSTGLFEAINADTLEKPLYVIIESDLTETGNIPLNKIHRKNNSNFSNYNIYITVNPGAQISITGNSSNGIIRFNGADSVFFGSNQPNSSITIFNTSIDDTASVFRIVTSINNLFNSENIHFENNIIKSNVNSLKSIGILIGTLVKTDINAYERTNNIFIVNNQFIDQKTSIVNTSNLGSNINRVYIKNLEIKGNTFTSNNIFDCISIRQLENVIISNNSFFIQADKNLNFVVSAINLRGYSNNVNISANKIKVVNKGSSVFGIHLNNINTNKLQIINNLIVIQDVFDDRYPNNNKESNCLGIFHSNNIDIYYNTFRVESEFGINDRNIRTYSSKYLNIVNNSFQISSKISVANFYHHLELYDDIFTKSNKFFNINNNHFEGPDNEGLISIFLSGQLYTKLSDLSMDLNFQNKNVVGISETSVNNYIPNNNILIGRALHINNITKDINGRTRKNLSCIGAFEIDSVKDDLSIIDIVLPYSCIDSNSYVSNLKIIVKNNTSDEIHKLRFKVDNGDTVINFQSDSIKLIQCYGIDTVLVTSGIPIKINSGDLKVYFNKSNDLYPINDTLTKSISYFQSTFKSLIDSQNYISGIGSTVLITPSDPLKRELLFYDKAVGGNLLYTGKSVETKVVSQLKSFYLDLQEKDRLDTIVLSNYPEFASSSGFYFSVHNANSYSIGIHTIKNTSYYLSKAINYKVYFKSGNYAGFELNANVWTLIKTGLENIASSDNFFISLDSNLIVGPGQTISFYVRCSNTPTNSFKIGQITNGNYSRTKDGVTLGFGVSTTSPEFSGTLIQNRRPLIDIHYNRSGLCMNTERIPIRVKAADLPMNVALKLEPQHNIIKRTGNVISPDIVCGNKGSLFSYRISALDQFQESNYGITWEVVYKKFFVESVTNGLTVRQMSTDTARVFNLTVPLSTDLPEYYFIEYAVKDLLTNGTRTFFRYLAIADFDEEVELKNVGSIVTICYGDSVKLVPENVRDYFTYEWSNGITADSIYVKESGTYKLKVFYFDCVYKEDSVKILAEPKQDSLKIIITNLGQCEYLFKVESKPSSGTLHWDFDDGNSVIADSIKHTYASDQLYEVKVQLQNSSFHCLENTTSKKLLNVTCPVGVNQEKLNFKINVYPNPVSSFLNVYSDNKILKLSLYDLTGRLLISEFNSKLSLSEMSPGSYILMIQTDKGTFMRKIIKD